LAIVCLLLAPGYLLIGGALFDNKGSTASNQEVAELITNKQ